jgi:DNA-binding response OmpR family regulator
VDQANVHQFDRSSSEPSAQHWVREASFADIALTSLGVYVNCERVAQRTPNHKSVGATVALVVEDDPDQLALATRCLTSAGYAVQSADCVLAFHDRLKKGVPDAIFLDVEMPDGNGFDVLAALRRDARYARLPVIMLTSRQAPQDIARGLALGADGYITKPYGRNTLEYALRYVMRQQLMQQPQASRAR